MKKAVFTNLLAVLLSICAAFCVGMACKGSENPQVNELKFNSFTVNGLEVSGTVLDDTEFSFLDEINISGNAEYIVSLDENGVTTFDEKVVTLQAGHNVFYVLATVNGQNSTYVVTIVRELTSYALIYNTFGGEAVNPSHYNIESETFTLNNPIKEGYDFIGWTYEGQSTPKMTVTVEKGSTGTKEYNANWQAIYTLNGGEVTGLTEYGKTLTSIDIPETIDGVTITAIANYAFGSCPDLQTIELPATIKSIGFCAMRGTEFYNNSSNWIGDTLYIGNYLLEVNNTTATTYTIAENVTLIATGAFSYCNNLTSLNVAQDNAYFIVNDGAIYSKDGSTLYHYIGKQASTFSVPSGVTTIATGAFFRSTLSSVTIPVGVIDIGDYAFAESTNLESVSISNTVVSIGQSAFYGCAWLTNVSMSNVETIGDKAFYWCASLETVNIGQSIASIGQDVFASCSSLSRINYEGTSTDWENVQRVTGWQGESINVIYCSGDSNVALP